MVLFLIRKDYEPQSGYDVSSYSKVFMFYKISGNFLKGACAQSVLSKKFVNKRKANFLCQRVSGYIFLVQQYSKVDSSKLIV